MAPLPSHSYKRVVQHSGVSSADRPTAQVRCCGRREQGLGDGNGVFVGLIAEQAFGPDKRLLLGHGYSVRQLHHLATPPGAGDPREGNLRLPHARPARPSSSQPYRPPRSRSPRCRRCGPGASASATPSLRLRRRRQLAAVRRQDALAALLILWPRRSSAHERHVVEFGTSIMSASRWSHGADVRRRVAAAPRAGA